MMEIDSLPIIFSLLAQMKPVFVFPDARMEVLDYLFMLKSPMLIVPVAVFVQPEIGLVFGDYNFLVLFYHAAGLIRISRLKIIRTAFGTTTIKS